MRGSLAVISESRVGERHPMKNRGRSCGYSVVVFYVETPVRNVCLPPWPRRRANALPQLLHSQHTLMSTLKAPDREWIIYRMQKIMRPPSILLNFEMLSSKRDRDANSYKVKWVTVNNKIFLKLWKYRKQSNSINSYIWFMPLLL